MVRRQVKAIVDTNIIFSAIFYKDGNEYKLFELADNGKLEIIIMGYVYDECKAILERKGIDASLFTEFLETFQNITLKELVAEEYKSRLEKASKTIRDAKDVPLFIFAEKEISCNEDTYLASGDKDFHTKQVKTALGGRVHTAKELIRQIKG
jgi:predicted nucleic acid-binding protein